MVQVMTHPILKGSRELLSLRIILISWMDPVGPENGFVASHWGRGGEVNYECGATRGACL